jgi:hypothetical protein
MLDKSEKEKLSYAYRVLHAGLDTKPTSLGMDISLALIGVLAGEEIRPEEKELLDQHEHMF